jgi:hypothetical protein
MLSRRTDEPADDVGDRLAAYAVARALSGRTRTGLPMSDVPPPVLVRERDIVHLQPVEERRGEPRIAARIEACASLPGTDTYFDGITVNVSRSGMHLQMPERPAGAHQDVLVSDLAGSAVLWVHVLEFRFNIESELYSWHGRVIAADEDWASMLMRLGLSPD